MKIYPDSGVAITAANERLLEAGLAFEVERLYREKYRCGEMNLNGISEALGIPYRKLYQIMEELGLMV